MIRHLLSTLILLCSVPMFGQIVRDGSDGTVEVSLVADANFSVSEMEIGFAHRGDIDGSQANAFYYASLSSAKDLAVFALGKSSPIFLAGSLVFNFSSAILSTPNTQTRLYDFIVPTTTNYKFWCSFKGDIDNPRNRFKLVSSTGTYYIDFQDSYSSNTDKIFQVTLPAGCYSAEVSVGSGSSVFFHTAGTLNSVRLSSTSPVQFTLPFICAVNSSYIPSVFPSQVSNAYLNVDFNGYPASNPNIISGNLTYSNLRPYGSIIVSPDYPHSHLRAVNKPIHVIQPQFHLLSAPGFNGTRATFLVQRDSNWEYDLYPDDWYDQDGDGIPDPPY
ncbi:MAG: hypothetical protein HY014_06490 [Acidobacteria bacterium]|nr:hypothetical protein [Acidobacteriota bacterium]MBI3487798.1 hypothetical protein [Acidobacteriota bacterium]